MKKDLADKILGDEKVEYALNKIVEQDWENPEEILKMIAHELGLDLREFWPEDNQELAEAFYRVYGLDSRTEKKKNDLKRLADELNVDLPKKSPADFVKELDDSKDKCFVWQMDMTDTQIIDFTERFRDEFIKKYNRDPQALHFIRNDVKSVEELDPDTVKSRVEPWLNNQGGE